MADPAGIVVYSPEVRIIYFDFGLQNEFQVDPLISPKDTLSGTPTILDPPPGLSISAGFITNGTISLIANCQANFLMSGWTPGLAYLLICKAATTQGNTMSMRGRVTCPW
jgi:hypothetical protein